MKLYKCFKWIPAVLLIIMPACSDSFLEVDPAGRLSSDIYPATDEEVLSTIIGVYDLMQWNYGRDWNSAYFAKNLPADDCNAGSSASDQLPYQNLDDFKNEADNPVTTAIWEGFYKAVNQCNTIIERIEPTSDFREQIIAEAKAIRAWNYFELVTLFGDVPFYTVNPTSVADYHKPRAPKADIYSQIETDLEDAISVLPLKSELPENQKFRVSRGTAQAILGKVYLYQERWNDAHTVLGQVISSQEYALEPDFGDVWKRAGELGTESVFEVLYTSQEGYDWGNFGWGGGAESNIHVQLMGPRAPFFGKLDTIGIIPGWGFNLPTASIGEAFDDMGDHGPRYEATIMSESEFIAAGGEINPDTDDDGNPVPAHDYEGYLRMKYTTFADQTNTSGASIPELNYTTNWRLIRYADVLLMAAEAYNEDDDEASARRELNKVRERAELDTYDFPMSKEDLREAIKAERQLELAFEGSRYWDLVRWGDAEEVLSPLGFVAGKHEHFPIPQSEISSNNEISQEDQNPGF
jgi:hypothetical protein